MNISTGKRKRKWNGKSYITHFNNLDNISSVIINESNNGGIKPEYEPRRDHPGGVNLKPDRDVSDPDAKAQSQLTIFV